MTVLLIASGVATIIGAVALFLMGTDLGIDYQTDKEAKAADRLVLLAFCYLVLGIAVVICGAAN
jgi:hypothetical protein